MPTKRKPPATKATKEIKRRKVATGILVGKTPDVIADAAGCTPRHVRRLAHEPETQLIITEVLKPHRAALMKLAGKVIAAIEGSLKANVGDKADHKNRMAAVQRYGDMLNLAQGQIQEEEAQHDPLQMTWEEFSVMYRRRNASPTQPQSMV